MTLESFRATTNGRPNLVSLANGNTLSETYLTDSNGIVCKFQQSVNVPSGSENYMFDLNLSLHHLLAWGEYKSNLIQYHYGNRRLYPKSSLKIIPVAPITTDQCGKSVGCFMVPLNCTSSENCDALVTYKYNATADAIDFVLTSTHAYIGFGHVDVVEAQKMVCNTISFLFI